MNNGKVDLAKLSREELLQGIKDGTIKSESYTEEEYTEKFSNHLGKYTHIIEIRKDDCVVKVHYNYNIHLDKILEFEGNRLQSLHARDIKLPPFDERIWDKERKITVRKTAHNKSSGGES